MPTPTCMRSLGLLAGVLVTRRWQRPEEPRWACVLQVQSREEEEEVCRDSRGLQMRRLERRVGACRWRWVGDGICGVC